MTFRNYGDLIRKVESLVPFDAHVFSTQSSENGLGFQLAVSFEYAQNRKDEIKDIANRLKPLFKSVKVTKSKQPQILIEYTQTVQNFRVIEVQA